MNATPPTDMEVRELVESWYRKLDDHVPAQELLPLLTQDGLSMRLPEGVLVGTHAFTIWYDGVIRRFFDEVHSVKNVVTTPLDAAVRVSVLVNWQARVWSPPAPKSQWLGFDAYQTWIIERSAPAGRAVIVTYIVDELRPMPGSGSL